MCDKSRNSEKRDNLEKEKSLGTHTYHCENLIQSYLNQDGVILAKTKNNNNNKKKQYNNYWIRLGGPQIIPHTYGQFMCNKDDKAIS